MRLKSLKFVRKGTTFFNSKNWGLCHEGLLQFFKVPKSATAVWFELHDKPGPKRIECQIDEVIVGDYTYPRLILPDYSISRVEIDEILRPYVGRTLYLACFHLV